MAALCARLSQLLILSLLATATVGARAQHDEERLRLMRETIAYTDVIDARDGLDRFDLDVQLAYDRVTSRGNVYRERTSGDGVRRQERVARAERTVSKLTLGFDVGLLRDVMLSARLPLVLVDARALTLADGVSASAAHARLSERDGSQALFTVPFAAPNFAGFDYLALGASWAVLNQMRRPWQPTWVLAVEGRRALGVPLTACRLDDEGASVCGSESSEDTDRDGLPDGTRRGAGSRGSSQGLSALILETRFSRRYRHAEPYAGLRVQLSWASTAQRAFRGGRPAPESSATLGVALIPWENRGTYQRFAIDIRLDATHVGEGLGYGPLFDALGTSSHPDLARARYPAGSCGEQGCGGARGAAFYGVTEMGAHLRYGGRLGIELTAARYVRFAVGASLRASTPHAVTGRTPCRGGGDGPVLSDDGRSCAGRVDLTHRGVIDAPGRRFFLRDELSLGGYAQATAMF